MSSQQAPSLVDGKNNSRGADDGGFGGSTSQSGRPVEETGNDGDLRREDDAPDRYDCRHTYQNMEMEAEDGETTGFRCNSWDCYCCAHRMRMNLIEDLEALIERRPEMRRLLTLTLDPEKAPRNQEDQHYYLTDRFNALRTELNDRYDDLSYVWIREEGESDNPHLHLLVDRFMPQDELSEMADRVGLGEVVDIRRVNARNAARYLTKYLTKGSMADLPKGIRRYGSSSDIPLQVRGGGGDDREWRLLMDDYCITSPDGEPLRRPVTRTDLAQQKAWDGPVPPDAPPPG